MAADNIILNSSDLNLSDDDIARQKLALWDEDDSASKHRRRIGSLVAVGDSWFSYPLGIDILDHLTRRGYEIRRFAKPGDTLENMVFGTSFNRHTFERRPAPLDEALRVLEAQQGVDAFLFSGGGNDMAGESLESFLEHSETPLPTVRADFVGHVIFRVFRSVYQAMIGRVRQKAPMIPILVHGYGWVIPDGRGYRRLGLEWAGPWLRPAFTKKGITDASERRAIVRSVIDQFNQMLAGIAEDHEGVHYIDLRSDIEDGDWENELHTTSASYGRIAERFHEVIVQARSAGIPDSGATAALGALLPAVTIDATLTSSASSPGGLAETLKPSLDGLRHVETGVDRFLERFRSQLQAEQAASDERRISYGRSRNVVRRAPTFGGASAGVERG